HGVHQQSGDDDVTVLATLFRPAWFADQNDRDQTQDAESETQREKSKRRRMLQTDFGGNEAGAPDRDEIPRQQGFVGAGGKRSRQDGLRRRERVFEYTGPARGRTILRGIAHYAYRQ